MDTIIPSSLSPSHFRCSKSWTSWKNKSKNGIPLKMYAIPGDVSEETKVYKNFPSIELVLGWCFIKQNVHVLILYTLTRRNYSIQIPRLE